MRSHGSLSGGVGITRRPLWPRAVVLGSRRGDSAPENTFVQNELTRLVKGPPELTEGGKCHVHKWN